MKELIEAGAYVNAKVSNNETTALMWAVFKNNIEIINALIKAGADVNAQNNYGETALIFAGKNTHTEAAAALAEAGADIKHKDNNGKTALYYALENEKVKRFEELSK